MSVGFRLRLFAATAILVFVALWVVGRPPEADLAFVVSSLLGALGAGLVTAAASTLLLGRELAELGLARARTAENLSTAMGELRDERDLVANIMGGMQEGVLVVDGGGAVRLVNPALREMFLLSADVVGRSVLAVLRHATLMELIERVRKKHEPATAEIELGGLKPRRVLVRVADLEHPKGALLAVFVDVTELRRLESLRRDFVSNVSHELRTPVTAIVSAAETLRGGAIGDRVAAERFVEIIERNSARLRNLIDDLLDLSRIEAREFKLRKEAVDVPLAIKHVIVATRGRADERNVELESESDAELSSFVTDRRALEQVLANLVENAVKYCPGARVIVRAKAAGDGVALEVEDTGPGIEAKHLPRIFERFYRVDAGRSRELGGTGLGLSIVKHLVEALGGTVSVESEIGKGTKFSIVLPQGRLPPSEGDPKALA